MATVLNAMRSGGRSYPARGKLGEMAYPGLVLFVTFVALICGGGTRQGLLSDALAQIVSLPLLAVAVSRLRVASSSKLRLPLFLIFAVALVPALQLVPLPPQVWTILPGRAELAEAYKAAGMSLPFLPISLEPLTTLRSLLSLLPAIAVFLGVLSLREEAEFRWLLLLIFFVAIAGAGLALMQLVGGVDSPLRFYDITDVHRGVGLFANSNHQAAFLYAVIPYAVIWASLSRHSPRERRVFHLTISAIVLIVIVIGLPATLSRFGVFLGLVAGLCSIPLLASLATGAERGRIIKIAAIANVSRTFAGVSIWICWARGAGIRDGEHSRYTLVARVNHGESRERLFPIRQRHWHICARSISVMNRSKICRSCTSIGRIMTGWSHGSRAAWPMQWSLLRFSPVTSFWPIEAGAQPIQICAWSHTGAPDRFVSAFCSCIRR